MLELVELVFAGSTGDELEVDEDEEEEEEAARVQSSQALPLSDDQEDPENFLVEVTLDSEEDVV